MEATRTPTPGSAPLSWTPTRGRCRYNPPYRAHRCYRSPMPNIETSPSEYNVGEPAPHTLHECLSAEDFRSQFELQTRCRIQDIANEVIAQESPKAIFVVGSVPLGMGS